MRFAATPKLHATATPHSLSTDDVLAAAFARLSLAASQPSPTQDAMVPSSGWPMAGGSPAPASAGRPGDLSEAAVRGRGAAATPSTSPRSAWQHRAPAAAGQLGQDPRTPSLSSLSSGSSPNTVVGTPPLRGADPTIDWIPVRAEGPASDPRGPTLSVAGGLAWLQHEGDSGAFAHVLQHLRGNKLADGLDAGMLQRIARLAEAMDLPQLSREARLLYPARAAWRAGRETPGAPLLLLAWGDALWLHGERTRAECAWLRAYGQLGPQHVAALRTAPATAPLCEATALTRMHLAAVRLRGAEQATHAPERRAQLLQAESDLMRLARAQLAPALVHVLLACSLGGRGELGRSVAHARAALMAAPDSLHARLALGEALLRHGRAKEGALALAPLIAARPVAWQGLAVRARALGALGRHREAAQALRAWIAKRPRAAMAHTQLGDALRRQGLFREAEAAYRRALALGLATHELGPAAEAHLGLGLALRGQRAPGVAQAPLRRAAQLQPGSLQAHVALGRACLDAGHAAEARLAFERALALAPEHVLSLAGLGQALVDLGHTAEGRSLMMRAARAGRPAGGQGIADDPVLAEAQARMAPPMLPLLA